MEETASTYNMYCPYSCRNKVAKEHSEKMTQSIAYLNAYCDVCVLLDQECYLEQYSFLILVLEFTSRQL